MEVIMALVLILIFLATGCAGIAAVVLWIWMLVDCLVNEPSEGNDKIVWVLVLIFTSWIGALIYLLVRRPKRIAEYGK
jgi:hypothetical protein